MIELHCTHKDVSDINRWALAQILKGDEIYRMDHVVDTWYVGKYCARAVPKIHAYIRAEAAPDGLRRRLLARLGNAETPLTDTGQMRSNGKHLICIFRTVDGVEIGVRDDYAKLITKGARLYTTVGRPAESLLVVRFDDSTPTAIFPPVQIPEVQT